MSMMPMKSRRLSPFPPTAGIPPILQTEKRTSALLGGSSPQWQSGPGHSRVVVVQRVPAGGAPLY